MSIHNWLPDRHLDPAASCVLKGRKKEDESYNDIEQSFLFVLRLTMVNKETPERTGRCNSFNS